MHERGGGERHGAANESHPQQGLGENIRKQECFGINPRQGQQGSAKETP